MTGATFANLPDQVCPDCGTRIRYASALEEGAAPKEGDVSICWECAGVAVYTAEGFLRKADAADLETLDADTQGLLGRARDRRREQLLEEQVCQGARERLFNAKDAPPSVLAKVATGEAAVMGAPVSLGPPPRRMRPAVRRRCSDCRGEVWVAKSAPAGRTMCPGCAATAVAASIRGSRS